MMIVAWANPLGLGSAEAAAAVLIQMQVFSAILFGAL